MPGSLAVVSFLLLMAAVWLLFSLLVFVYVQSTWNMSYFINRGPEHDSAMFCGIELSQRAETFLIHRKCVCVCVCVYTCAPW